jgi:hypothetical protein
MKLTLKLELSQMKEKHEVTGTPIINQKSKMIAERKLLGRMSPGEEQPLPVEVYNRLYEIGKQRIHQRNQTDARFQQTPIKGGVRNLSNLHSTDGPQHQSQLSVSKEIKSDLSFHPTIHKRS